MGKMKIGLISDTHISQQEESLPLEVRKIFTGVDLILHAGDIYTLSVLDELETIAPVMAVRGNGDIWLPDDHRLKDNIVLNLQGFRIGVTHGIDYPEPSWRTLEEAMQYEFGGKVHILIFGDSHVDMSEIDKGVFLINPGSPTFPRQIKEKGTVALLKINSKSNAEARIISIATRQTAKTLSYKLHGT